MSSLDANDLVYPEVKLGGLLDINVLSFADSNENHTLLEAINDLRTQIIQNPEGEFKIPELLRNPIGGSDADYIGSDVLRDFELRNKPESTCYKWLRHRLTFEFCDSRNMIPSDCTNNLAINLKLFEYVKLPIIDHYIYNHEMEIYKFLIENGVRSWDLQANSISNLEIFKYLLTCCNIFGPGTRQAFINAVENDMPDIASYIFEYRFHHGIRLKNTMFYQTTIYEWIKNTKNPKMLHVLHGLFDTDRE
jgi:hypothetical protein